MKKEKILKFILLLAISFAVMRIYELMQYFVGVYVFGFKLDTPPNVSQAFFDTVCCSFQIAVFWILYMMTKRLYFDRVDSPWLKGCTETSSKVDSNIAWSQWSGKFIYGICGKLPHIHTGNQGVALIF